MAAPEYWRRLAVSLALVLGVVLPAANADFVVESGTLEVELPISGRGRYGMSLANFGDPIYGGTLRQVKHSRKLHQEPLCVHFFRSTYLRLFSVSRGQLVYMRDEQSRYGCEPFKVLQAYEVATCAIVLSLLCFIFCILFESLRFLTRVRF